jgi:4-hydroxy-2-oxoglutarate aldolase
LLIPLKACLTSLFKPEEFGVYGGLADTILHGLLASSGLGAVSGLANITPRACVEVVKLFQAGKLAEAKALQGEISLAGRVELKGGVPGMRYGVERWLGYGGDSRRPLPPASDEVSQGCALPTLQSFPYSNLS